MMPVDLRSDTVTRPDAAMRRAMAEAEVGDDGFGEDPTVRQLEDLAAETLGQETALFVPSGIMANQLALHLLGRPGGVVLCEADCHLMHYEMGAMGLLTSMMPNPIVGQAGRLDPAKVEAAIVPSGGYKTPTTVLALENTHNMAGGRVVTPEQTDALVAVARRHGLPVHLDGARVFNAAVALDVPVDRLTSGVDTVSFCLSKGLGAPVGSLLCGRAEVMQDARRVRKSFGGAMRQAGVLAAAGLLALREGPGRLAEDHVRARRLAVGLAGLPGLHVDVEAVETNIVIVEVTAEAPVDVAQLLTELAQEQVKIAPIDAHRIRLVTHRDVDDADIERALVAFAEALLSE